MYQLCIREIGKRIISIESSTDPLGDNALLVQQVYYIYPFPLLCRDCMPPSVEHVPLTVVEERSFLLP
jgi:hypothetical protein